VGFTQAAWGWYYGYWLIIALACTITVFPILKVLVDEYQELAKIKQSKKAMGITAA
jgi:hypothetical protein